MSETDGAVEVPLIEQLRSVAEDYRICVPIQWDEDGRETGHRFIPVGRMMHRAAAELERMTADRDDFRRERNVLQKICAERSDEIERLTARVAELETENTVLREGRESDARAARLAGRLYIERVVQRLNYAFDHELSIMHGHERDHLVAAIRALAVAELRVRKERKDE